MPVYGCAGGCDRMISVSSIPGGNPVALNDPENYAVKFKICEKCSARYCDRCADDSVTACADCGGTLTSPESGS